MTQYITVQQDNHDYQRDFATALIKSLGYEGAVQACYENQWHGVLGAVHRCHKKKSM